MKKIYFMKRLLVLLLLLFNIAESSFAQDATTAKIIFFRTKKFAASASEFIVGSPLPDTVFVQLKNGSYHELLVHDFRDWEFVGGFFSITAYRKLSVEPGKTYYIQCLLLGGFPVKAGFELVPEETALQEMAALKPMRKKGQ